MAVSYNHARYGRSVHFILLTSSVGVDDIVKMLAWAEHVDERSCFSSRCTLAGHSIILFRNVRLRILN